MGRGARHPLAGIERQFLVSMSMFSFGVLGMLAYVGGYVQWFVCALALVHVACLKGALRQGE